MAKLLLKISALIIIIIAINSLLFSFMHLPFSWGYYYGNEKCIESNARDYNLLLIGSSRMGRQVNPGLLDSLNSVANENTRSVNLGMDGLTIAEEYYQFKHIISLENVHPKFILVELCDVDTFLTANMHTVRKKYYFNANSYYNSVVSLMQSAYSTERKILGSLLHTLNYFENIIRFNEFGVALKFKRFDIKADCNCDSLYRPFIIKSIDTATIEFYGVTQPSPHAQFMKHTFYLKENEKTIKRILSLKPGDVGPVDMNYLKMVNEMIDLGKKNSARVIFVLPPKVDEAYYRTVRPVFNLLKPENKIDLSDPTLYPEFYNLEYAYDLGHLDIAGSTIYTKKLSEQFLKRANLK